LRGLKQGKFSALALAVAGDHRGVAGIGRIDESGHVARAAVVAEPHGSQIETHLVRRRE
jgi:hypothetical protein